MTLYVIMESGSCTHDHTQLHRPHCCMYSQEIENPYCLQEFNLKESPNIYKWCIRNALNLSQSFRAVIFFCPITSGIKLRTWKGINCGTKSNCLHGERTQRRAKTPNSHSKTVSIWLAMHCRRISRICGGQLRPAGTTQRQAAAGLPCTHNPGSANTWRPAFHSMCSGTSRTQQSVTDRKTGFWQDRSQKDYRTCREVSSLLMRQHGGGETGEGRASLVNTDNIMRPPTVTTLGSMLLPLGHKGGSAQGCMQQTQAYFTTTDKQ